MQRRWGLLAFTLIAAACWWRACTNYVADDSYFYLVIARNLARTGHQTFSGLFPTNGVHPLWTYLLAGYTYLAWKIHPAWVENPAFAVPLSAALLLAGAWQFNEVARRYRLNVLWLVYLPLGYLTLLGVLYSEAHALYAAIAVLTRFSLSDFLGKKWGPVLAGIAAGAVFLARLDSITVVACYGVWLIWRFRKPRPVLYFAIAFFSLTAPYVLSNMIWFGGPMPISGWMKSSFPHFYLRGLERHGLATALFGYNLLFGIVSIAIAPLALSWARRESAETRHICWVLWGGSVLHLVYVGLFTRSHTAWYWYYVLPFLTGCFALAIAAKCWAARHRMDVVPSAGILRGRIGTTALLTAAWVGVTFATRFRSSTGLQTPLLDYLRTREIQDSTILVSDYPGYLGFVSNNHIIAADMLTGYQPLYQQMHGSAPNALQALQDACRRSGHPIRFIVFRSDGDLWLEPGKTMRSITLNDPRAYPRLVQYGVMQVATPVVVGQRSDGGFTAIWDLRSKVN